MLLVERQHLAPEGWGELPREEFVDKIAEMPLRDIEAAKVRADSVCECYHARLASARRGLWALGAFGLTGWAAFGVALFVR